MSKVITFAQRFMKGHPKYVQKTHFVKKILRQQNILICGDYWDLLKILNDTNISNGKLSIEILRKFYEDLQKSDEPLFYKHHTIRAGHRWKVGDKFSPRVWSGKPYR